MKNQFEIWKDILGYENLYQVSNFGNVKSLERIIYNNGSGNLNLRKSKVLSLCLNTENYYNVVLSKNGKTKTYAVHVLVAIAFLNHKPCGFKLVVNHKDFNKQNNKVNNLEVITNRQNSNKKHIPHSSKFTGVTFNIKSKKWISNIRINGVLYNLGSYEIEIEASKSYELALKKWNEKRIIPVGKKHTSIHKGICFVTSRQKWNLCITKNGIRINYGYFNSEQSAYNKKIEIQNV